MFPIVAYVFFVWLLIAGARENGIRWAALFLTLGVALLLGFLLGWFAPFVLTIGVCALDVVMILSIWGTDPWS